MISVTFYQFAKGVTVNFTVRVLLLSEALLIHLGTVLFVSLQILHSKAPDEKFAILGVFCALLSLLSFFNFDLSERDDTLV